MSKKDWFDDYMAYKMCCEDNGNSSGGSNSNSGGLSTIFTALFAFGPVSVFVR